MSSPKAFLKKVVRMRKRLVKDGSSRRQISELTKALRPIEGWLAAYPNASEQAARKVIIANQERVMKIIPGQGCPAHQSLMDELNHIINNQIQLDL